jgi:hypothetical protein
LFIHKHYILDEEKAAQISLRNVEENLKRTVSDMRGI